MIAFIIFISLFIGLFWKGNLLFIACISVLWLAFVLWRFSKKGFIIGLLVLMGGIIYGNIPIPCNKNATDFEGFVVDSKDNYFLFESRLTKYYIYEKNNTRETGDFLEIKGTISTYRFPVIESRLDFNTYLKNKGVDLQIYSSEIKTRFMVPLRRKEIMRRFCDSLNQETQVIVQSLLFGETEYENEIIQNAKNLQIIHIVSFSGVHLNLLFMAVVYLLGLLVPEKWTQPLTVALLSPYLFLIITKIASIRIIGMVILKWSNETFWRSKLNQIQMFSLLGVICLLVSRYIVYQNGFIFSFGIAMLIMFSREAFSSISKRKNRLIVPLCIFVFFLPIIASLNYEVNLLSFLTQFLFLPIFFFVYLISLFSFYAYKSISVLNFFGTSIATSLAFFSRLDFSVLTGVIVPALSLIFYVGCFAMLLGLETKHKTKIEFGLSCVLTSIVLSILPIQNALTNSVTFINVGQGDAILIREGQNTVLIDTGGSIYFDIASECLIPYFKKEKISKIDYLITTHNDNDHCGGKESLMDKFRVKNYVNLFEAFPLHFGSLNLVNLNRYATEQTDDNDSSLFLYLEFLNRKWLFTGDASTLIENKIIKDNPNLDVDILKVGHHGSDSSTSDVFLQAITPTEAIISVGKNIYGHPTAKVLARLAKYGIKVRRTDLEGTITYTEWTF